MSNAHQNDKLINIKDRFGMWGLGVYWDLVARVSDQFEAGDEVPEAQFSLSDLCSFYGSKRNKLRSFLDHSQNVRLLFYEQNENILKIKIPTILKHKDNATRNLQATCKQLASNLPPEEEERKRKRRLKNRATSKTKVAPSYSCFGEHEDLIRELVADFSKQAPQPVSDTWIKTAITKIRNHTRAVVVEQAHAYKRQYLGTGKNLAYFLAMVERYVPPKGKRPFPTEIEVQGKTYQIDPEDHCITHEQYGKCWVDNDLCVHPPGR